MGRIILPLFAVVAYFVFLATFLYLVGFVGDFGALPATVDRHASAAALLPALIIDVALIALFGVQHSVMARPAFKRRWMRIVPPAIERSIFVLCASLMLILLFALWQPIPAQLWRIDSATGAAAIWALFGLGWLIVLVSTFLLNHFELFGLMQVADHLRGKAAAAPVLREPFLYKAVRHPLYSGFILAFWAIPTMTVGHLALALGMSVYILIAIMHEERDLVDVFGPAYEHYRSRVGMLVPRLRRRT
jgi:protein-S-isoprenylcysteine O-methyltransferase Ste14